MSGLKYTPLPFRGGPLHGRRHTLSSPRTLEFTLRGQTGYYDKGACWVPTGSQCAERNTTKG